MKQIENLNLLTIIEMQDKFTIITMVVEEIHILCKF